MSVNESLATEGKRQMQICNACRYCEGYCAVWRAIEWRQNYTEKDLAYFSNLCHDCRDCVFACPFTTPHEFGVNPPKLFAGLREETYREYAWPGGFKKLVGRGSRGFWIAAVVAMILIVVLVAAINGPTVLVQRHVGTGAFYKVISELVLEIVFGVLGLWLLAGWVVGANRFWRDIKSESAQPVTGRDIRRAASHAMRLRYLGKGSTEEDLGANRKWMHHLVAYGFLLDFASTILAAIYSHIFHIDAPYPVYHPVVILGILGGISIIIGASGMLYARSRSTDDLKDCSAVRSGNAFSVSLLMVALTGMLVLFFRTTDAMPIILAVHLGTVASLFFTAPYTKFVHFIYRYLALVRYAQEERTAEE